MALQPWKKMILNFIFNCLVASPAATLLDSSLSACKCDCLDVTRMGRSPLDGLNAQGSFPPEPQNLQCNIVDNFVVLVVIIVTVQIVAYCCK